MLPLSLFLCSAGTMRIHTSLLFLNPAGCTQTLQFANKLMCLYAMKDGTSKVTTNRIRDDVTNLHPSMLLTESSRLHRNTLFSPMIITESNYAAIVNYVSPV